MRRFLSILLFPISLLWYDRDEDDVIIRPWLFWFAVVSTVLGTVVIAVQRWLEIRAGP